jgi:preprotein translocase subunit SecE
MSKQSHGCRTTILVLWFPLLIASLIFHFDSIFHG